MPKLDRYSIPAELRLGVQKNDRVPHADQDRQRVEVEEILDRLRRQPGVVLADEVGMGKTFVALAVAYSVATLSRRGPVIVMAPPNLIDKWQQDLATFCELYLEDRCPVFRDEASPSDLRSCRAVRYGVARHSVELLKLMDDPARERCHLIFLAQGAMTRRQSDKWVSLALIREAFRRHGRRESLKKVRQSIHRFMGRLLGALGEERATDLGDELWSELLRRDPMEWKDYYNEVICQDKRRLPDDPVPQAVVEAFPDIDLSELADALEQLPLRESKTTAARITNARRALRHIEHELWGDVLASAPWQSPLLIMDEAHHLKNPGTSLAKQLKSLELDGDLRVGDGALAHVFDRMLFLTATPFQLGHQELVSVLNRFGDVRRAPQTLGSKAAFESQLTALAGSLTESQRTAIVLQRCWALLRPEEGPADQDVDAWWEALRRSEPDELTPRQRALVGAFSEAHKWRTAAEANLRPWVIRHNKGEHWPGTGIQRRRRLAGAASNGDTQAEAGLDVPPDQLLPFFLAARSDVSAGRDLLGDALCSSYEAFRYTRQQRVADRDELDGDEQEQASTDLSQANWYLAEFDFALQQYSGNIHPKISSTVRQAVDLWEAGEKVLVFAFYRQTCRALRLHISEEIRRRMNVVAQRRFAEAGRAIADGEIERVIESIQDRYFDDAKRPGRVELDRALEAIIHGRKRELEDAELPDAQHSQLLDVMRRFLRVPTTLVRCFPIGQHDQLTPALGVEQMLAAPDGSGVTWRKKFEAFIDFLVDRCSSSERLSYLEAAARTQTGGIRVTTEETETQSNDDDEDADSAIALANVQVAMGTTRREQRSRLMRAFNTPFFPDILVCSQVMGEGVDLHRYCRHIIHHDLAWNPSVIEQRTGRIDRLGCKAEGEHPIQIFLPYLSGTADERQYRVMRDREQWFRIVMGQDEVAKLIPENGTQPTAPLPDAFGTELAFDLTVDRTPS
ncbi:helicase-related protein [Candidatus Laterigemmans baculatus]|uniref:helicase-related protein n=1 Tax=Candidatus Laterigemmans baculatus TaxID=2770505 RepID=UPI0013D932F0|nr:DEAD/DEAH box helicase [Candidatus Laterigemmans baculatus]